MGAKARFVCVLVAVVVAAGCASPSGGRSHDPLPAARLADPAKAPAPAELRGVVTFAQVREAVLEAHPELAALAYERQAREGAAAQASRWPNPSVGVEMENMAGSGEFGGTGAMESTVGIRQEIPLGGQIGKRTTVARLESELVDWETRERTLALSGQARMAFAEVAAAQDRLEQARQNEELVQRLVAGVNQRVTAGDVSPVEKTKARVELSTARIERRRAERELAAARARLAGQWGAAEATFARVEASPATAGLPPLDRLQAILMDHPRLQRWEAETGLREARVRLAEAAAWPSIEVGAGVRRFNDSDDHAYLLEVGVPLPFFDRNEGGIAEARATLAMAAAEREAVQRELKGELMTLYASLQAEALVVTDLREGLLPEAEETHEAVAKAYAAGQGGLLDLLDAERTMLATRRSLVEAAVGWRLMRAELEALLGVSLDETITINSDRGDK